MWPLYFPNCCVHLGHANFFSITIITCTLFFSQYNLNPNNQPKKSKLIRRSLNVVFIHQHIVIYFRLFTRSHFNFVQCQPTHLFKFIYCTLVVYIFSHMSISLFKFLHCSRQKIFDPSNFSVTKLSYPTYSPQK